MARKRKPLSRSTKIAIGVGATALGLTIAGAVVQHRRRRKQQALSAEGRVVVPTGDANIPTPPLPPKPSSPEPSAELPPEILEGGVPLPAGWTTAGWYTYDGRWIRVDESNVIATNIEEGTSDSLFDRGDRRYRVEGSWRWTVIAGQATPLATELHEAESYIVDVYVPLWEFRDATELARDDMTNYMARLASDWIDTAFGGG